MPEIPQDLKNVTLQLKATIYFEGGVTSHTTLSRDGRRRSVGLIRPGTYHFTTDTPEQMDIIAGSCRVKPAGEGAWITYTAGQTFHVAGKSSFDIAVDTGFAEYLCTFA